MASIMSSAPTTDDRTPIMRLCPINFLKTCHSVLNAPSKIKIGRKMASTP